MNYWADDSTGAAEPGCPSCGHPAGCGCFCCPAALNRQWQVTAILGNGAIVMIGAAAPDAQAALAAAEARVPALAGVSPVRIEEL